MPTMVDGELCYTTEEVIAEGKKKIKLYTEQLRQELREARKDKEGIII